MTDGTKDALKAVALVLGAVAIVGLLIVVLQARAVVS